MCAIATPLVRGSMVRFGSGGAVLRDPELSGEDENGRAAQDDVLPERGHPQREIAVEFGHRPAPERLDGRLGERAIE